MDDSKKRSTSRSPSPRRSRGDDDMQESRSHSKSSKYREHKESGHRSMKNYSRSRSHSMTRSRKSYRSSKYESRRGGSRSRSRSPYRSRVSRSRSRSYSRSRYSRDCNLFRSDSRSPMSTRRRHIGNRENPYPSRCLGVFGLSICTTEQQLYHLFSKYGPVENVVVVNDAKTKRPKGFCFVYFESLEDAKVAKEQCSGMEIEGRRIRVDYSITERAHTPTPGVYIGKPTDVYNSRGGGGGSGGGGGGGGGGGNWDGPRRRDYNNSRGNYRRSPSPYYSNRRRPRYDRRSRSPSYSPRKFDRYTHSDSTYNSGSLHQHDSRKKGWDRGSSRHNNIELQ